MVMMPNPDGVVIRQTSLVQASYLPSIESVVGLPSASELRRKVGEYHPDTAAWGRYFQQIYPRGGEETAPLYDSPVKAKTTFHQRLTPVLFQDAAIVLRDFENMFPKAFPQLEERKTEIARVYEAESGRMILSFTILYGMFDSAVGGGLPFRGEQLDERVVLNADNIKALQEGDTLEMIAVVTEKDVKQGVVIIAGQGRNLRTQDTLIELYRKIALSSSNYLPQ
jgi:hypothetical protein